MHYSLLRLIGSNLADVLEIKIKPINLKFCAVNILFRSGFMKPGFGKPDFRRANHSQLNLGLGELTLAGKSRFLKNCFRGWKIKVVD